MMTGILKAAARRGTDQIQLWIRVVGGFVDVAVRANCLAGERAGADSLGISAGTVKDSAWLPPVQRFQVRCYVDPRKCDLEAMVGDSDQPTGRPGLAAASITS
eukprot:Skav231325  [mRNA]  locus=scaffold819:43496:43804:- [translate_table: standard]